MGQKIVLASASPRRKELLKGLGLTFAVDVCPVDEEMDACSINVSPAKWVMFLAQKKAKAVVGKYQEGLVIGADTVVFLPSEASSKKGEVFGKPKDDAHAFTMLMKLQGRKHQVYSGVAILDAATGKEAVSFTQTDVEFCTLQEEEIKRYIATKEPEGKAGAYAIQGLGATMVQRIEGDYFNVVGLPLFLLGKMLQQFGVKVI